jgi:SH3-like domain-containing protein
MVNSKTRNLILAMSFLAFGCVGISGGKIAERMPTPTPLPVACPASIDAGQDGTVNLRQGPGTQYAAYDFVLLDGEPVRVVQDMGAWSRVIVTRGIVEYDGYVNSRYIKKGC